MVLMRVGVRFRVVLLVCDGCAWHHDLKFLS